MSTKSRICTVPKDFGMASKRRSNWSTTDENTLFTLLKTDTSFKTILLAFPGKTETQVKSKIYKMGFNLKERG